VDGVDVLALVGEGAARGEVEAGGAAKDDGVRGQRLAVIINYRPSVAQHVLEFPAGLVDQDETPARAAERELKEETGLDGRCASCSPPLLVDPWKSNESLRLAHVELPEDAAPRAQSLEENESILLLLLPLRGLLDELRRLMRQHGLGIDGKLFAFALGLEVARSGRIPPLE
jgi:8-oxo-dGTP pyrophosphatase MutT (NUDIX family)